jgi:hypothetical protein
MPDFASRRPIETEKSGAYLHERSHIPASPMASPVAWARSNAGFLLGVAFGIGLVAVAFTTRASWNVHRDWVVPALIPPIVAGGVCIGHLIGRRELNAVFPALLFLAISVAFIGFNAMRAVYVDRPDGLRDSMTIVSALSLGLTFGAALFATVWVELRRPTRAPAPEL